MLKIGSHVSMSGKDMFLNSVEKVRIAVFSDDKNAGTSGEPVRFYRTKTEGKTERGRKRDAEI